MATNKPEKTYTIEDFISMRTSDNITYYNYSILRQSTVNDRITYSEDNIIYGYLDELKEKRQLLVLSDTEILKYKYKPKLLAYDIYGSTEIYFVILALNGMCSIKEFDLYDGKIYALYPSDMSNYMTYIYSAEQEYIKLNRASL